MKKLSYCLRRGIWVCLAFVSVLHGSEPEHCAAIKPPKSGKEPLIHWLLNNGSSELKEHGCWEKHLELGNLALIQTDKKKDARSIMQLSLQMASSAFYLGDYDHSFKLAESALEDSRQLKDTVAETEALYLLSANARARGEPGAVALAQEALSVFQKASLDDPVLEGKIYFNLGAALSDTSPQQLDKSKQYLQKAYRLFSANQRSRDALRAGLRWVRVEYLQANFEEALKLFKSFGDHFSKDVEGPRLQMLYDYQYAKVLHRLSQWREADARAQNAMKLAEQLNTTKDRERIEKLLKAIRAKTFLPD